MDVRRSFTVALCPTKKMFWEWTGQTVPQPDREKSYGQQYKELHKAFEDRRSRISEGTLPVYAGVMQWGFSVDDWKTVQKDPVYYEAYREVTALLTPEHRKLLRDNAQAFGYIGVLAAYLDVPKC